jgi:hypothetical protein
VSLGNVVNQFLDQHRLANTSTAKETNLSTTGIRGQKVDNLDTSLENFSGGGLVNEWGRVRVNRAELDALDGTTLVNGFANNVHDAAESSGTNRDLNGGTSVDNLLATDETFRTVHSNGTDGVLTEMWRNLKNKTITVETLDLEGIEDGREIVSLKLNVDDGTNDRFHGTNGSLGFCCISACYIPNTAVPRVKKVWQVQNIKVRTP